MRPTFPSRDRLDQLQRAVDRGEHPRLCLAANIAAVVVTALGLLALWRLLG